MTCGSNCGPGQWSPEYNRYFKPENNNGCACSGDRGCDAPSNARDGSPKHAWEQIYGKLVTYFYKESDENGHSYVRIERRTCPVEKTQPKRNNCCSLRYKIVR